MQKELNARLLAVCTADVVDYELAEELLKQGAEPMGEVFEPGTIKPDNLYACVVSELFDTTDTPEDFYRITALFLRYGMDVSKPAVPYGFIQVNNDYYDDVLHPLWFFAFLGNETVKRTLKLLLDHGLKAEDASECWGHAVDDFVNIQGDLSDPWVYQEYEDYIRKIMLIASYPHIVNEDECLRREIWYDYNSYELEKFRNWNDYRYEIDTSHCNRYPRIPKDVYRSIVTIIEKETDKPVWKFGVDITPEEAGL